MDAAATTAADPYPVTTVLHWYDFVCPFCYLAQPDNAALLERGLALAELAFVAHPEIPDGGAPILPVGPRFEMMARLADERHLPLYWSDRLPNTRVALAAAEWIRHERPHLASGFRTRMFAANFDLRRDIGRLSVVLDVVAEAGVDPGEVRYALSDGAAERALRRSNTLGRRYGVRGTPAWWFRGRLFEGLQPRGFLQAIQSGD